MKNCIRYIFAFSLSFFLFVLVLFSVTRFTILGESYFFARLNQSEYYESTVVQFNRVLKQNTRPTNFPVELFDNYVKTADVIDEMKAYVEAGFDGETYEIDSSAFRTKMETTIQTYIIENGITIDTATQTAIDSFVEADVKNYEKMIAFPYFEYIGKVFVTGHKAYLIGAPILLILCAILALVQIRLHKSRRKKKRWLAYSLIGNGLLLCVCPALLLGFRVFDRIQLQPQYLYSLVTNMMNRYCIILVVSGLISILMGLFLSLYKKKNKSKKNSSGRNYEHSVKLDGIAKE